jgi:phage terminase large subunit-like protein
MHDHQRLMTTHYRNPVPDKTYDLEEVKANLERIVIGVDPAVTSGEHSNETGIVVAGVCPQGLGFVLEDLSIRCPAPQWAAQILKGYKKWEADRGVAETNQGGDLVESMLRVVDPKISYRGVKATRGKRMRAEPIAALYEQETIFHLHRFEELEKQMVAFEGKSGVPGCPNDRLDALVWAFTELMLEVRQVRSRPRVSSVLTGRTFF